MMLIGDELLNLINEKNTYDRETSIQYIVAEACDTDGK